MQSGSRWIWAARGGSQEREKEMPASAGQACRIKEISSAFPFPPPPPYQVPNGLRIPKLGAPSTSGLAELPCQLPGTGERIGGIWVVLKADITETPHFRKTTKSYMGRKKITEEPAREMSTKNLTMREDYREQGDILSVPSPRTCLSP